MLLLTKLAKYDSDGGIDDREPAVGSLAVKDSVRCCQVAKINKGQQSIHTSIAVYGAVVDL